jgi:hypothetical protein
METGEVSCPAWSVACSGWTAAEAVVTECLASFLNAALTMLLHRLRKEPLTETNPGAIMKLSTIHAPRETPITIEIDEILDRRAQAVPGGVTSFDRPAEPQAVVNRQPARATALRNFNASKNARRHHVQYV